MHPETATAEVNLILCLSIGKAVGYLTVIPAAFWMSSEPQELE